MDTPRDPLARGDHLLGRNDVIGGIGHVGEYRTQ